MSGRRSQGGSCLATLGFGAQSLWDCRAVAGCHPAIQQDTILRYATLGFGKAIPLGLRCLESRSNRFRVPGGPLVTGSFLRIANVKLVAHDDGMVPRLSLQRFEGGYFVVVARICAQQHDPTVLRGNQK